MLDHDQDGSLRPGAVIDVAVIAVDDVRCWHAERRDSLQFWLPSSQIRHGRRGRSKTHSRRAAPSQSASHANVTIAEI